MEQFISIVTNAGNGLVISVMGPFPNEGQAQAACEEYLIANRPDDFKSSRYDPETIDWWMANDMTVSAHRHRIAHKTHNGPLVVFTVALLCE